jgi:hypothetical protein
MFRFGWIAFPLLIAYSAALIGIEWHTSQDYVRNFFCDIEGPVPFYAVNTTISVFLLWATALLFAVCLACERGDPARRRARWFYLSQILVFAWLGMDDRFKLHEAIAGRLGIGDHYVLSAVAAVEVALLVFLGGAIVFRRAPLIRLGIASMFFVVMLFFDAVYPHDAVLRLSLEDIAKTWGTFFFSLFAWQLFTERIGELPLVQPAAATRAA